MTMKRKKLGLSEIKFYMPQANSYYFKNETPDMLSSLNKHVMNGYKMSSNTILPII